MTIILIGVLCMLPVTSIACGDQAHPDICQGAICGSEQDLRDWLESQKKG